MIFVIINGTSKVGKDKFVKLFKKLSKFRVKNLSTVDKIKLVSKKNFGWDGKKNDKSRKFLSDLKKCWSEFNDGPNKYILETIKKDKNFCLKNDKNIENNIYFIHIREPNEILKMKNELKTIGKCLTLLIRKNVNHIPDNQSDMNVENYKYDYIVDNNSNIDKLKENINKFKKFLNEK